MTAVAPAAPAADPAVAAPVLRLQAHAVNPPGPVALRHKFLGLWQDVDWPTYWDQAQLVGHALLSLGIEPGDRVGVHAENRPEWVFTDWGCQAVRAACVGLYPTSASDEVAYLLGDAGIRILVAEDQEQADKVLDLPEGSLPALEHIVYIEPGGIQDEPDPRLMSWDDFIARGEAHRAAHPSAVDERLAAIRQDDLAVMVYTSGTTGPPKGVMLTVGNIDFAIRSSGNPEGFFTPPLGPDDILLSYLPLCHVYERLLTCWLGMGLGVAVHFAESIDTVQTDVTSVQPTVFASVPRILEKMHAGVQVRMSAASPFKKLNFAVWSKVADRIGAIKAANQGGHTPVSRILQFFGDIFLFRALKERLGLRRARAVVSGAAPISPEILQWFMGIGVPMGEAYGMTENCAIATANPLTEMKLGTVGKPVPGAEVRLDESSGEILVRHPAVFAGYWGLPDKTAEALDADGWLHTGDVGEWDGDHLKIVDRLKDIIITSGGKNISPSEIENQIKTSPFIKEAVVIGDGRKFISALIGIDLDVVGQWAQSRKLSYTTYGDLSRKPDVVELIKAEIDKTNEKFARVEQVKEFRLLPKELDQDDGEVTATQKVKRSAIEQIYDELISDMYGPRKDAA